MLFKCVDRRGTTLEFGRFYEGTYINDGKDVVLYCNQIIYESSRFLPYKIDTAIENIQEKDKTKEENETLKAKIKELENELKKCKLNNKKPFIELNQGYFYIDSTFEPRDLLYSEDCFNEELKEYGNMYPYTKENKDEVLEKVKLIAERNKLKSKMEQFAMLNNEIEIDWNDREQWKWYLYVSNDLKSVEIASVATGRHMNTTYFSSKEIAEKALERFKYTIEELYLDRLN